MVMHLGVNLAAAVTDEGSKDLNESDSLPFFAGAGGETEDRILCSTYVAVFTGHWLSSMWTQLFSVTAFALQVRLGEIMKTLIKPLRSRRDIP